MTNKMLVDTSVLIDHFQDLNTSEAEFFREQVEHDKNRILITSFSIYEVLVGLRKSGSSQSLETALFQLEIISPCTPDLMRKASQNYLILRRKGITIRSAIDCIIATCAIENDYFLLHRDRDFKPFEKHLGLKNPLR